MVDHKKQEKEIVQQPGGGTPSALELSYFNINDWKQLLHNTHLHKMFYTTCSFETFLSSKNRGGQI